MTALVDDLLLLGQARPGAAAGPGGGRPAGDRARRPGRRPGGGAQPHDPAGRGAAGRHHRRRHAHPAGGRQPGPQRARAHARRLAGRDHVDPARPARVAVDRRPRPGPAAGGRGAGLRALLPRRRRAQPRPRRLRPRPLDRGRGGLRARGQRARGRHPRRGRHLSGRVAGRLARCRPSTDSPGRSPARPRWRPKASPDEPQEPAPGRWRAGRNRPRIRCRLRVLLLRGPPLGAPAAPALATPTPGASATASPVAAAALDGNWTVASGSQAEYRVNEAFAGQTSSHQAVARTSAVSGAVTVTGSRPAI